MEALLPHEFAKLVFWELEVGYVNRLVGVVGVRVLRESILVLTLVEGVQLVQLVQLLPDAGYARVWRVLSNEAM